MSGYVKALIIVIFVTVISVGALFIYLNLGRNSKDPEPVASAGAPVGFQPGFEDREEPFIPGEAGYEETVTTVMIGTDRVAIGNFIKVELGEIYYSTPVGGSKMPLTTDEVVVACTNQDLTGASELDFSQVTSVKITNPTEMENLLEADVPVVIFSDIVDGSMMAHTVAVPGSSCPQ